MSAGLLVAAVVGSYGRVLKGLAAQWASSPDASYGAILAAVAAYLAWRRRRTFASAFEANGPRVLPLAALVAGAAVFIVGQLGADLFLTRLSLVIVLAAAIWFVAGPRAARTMAAPLAFLAMAIPLPDILVNAITLPLQLVASQIAEWTLALAGVPVFRDGNVLALPSTTLEVAEACSGLRSLVSLIAIGVLFAWVTRASAGRRVALVGLSVPVAIVANGLRIAATGLACESFGPRAASGATHELTGWVTFVGSGALLAAIARAWTPTDAPGTSGVTPGVQSVGAYDDRKALA
ncbi:MAG TPA: exosortase/archaeosortase family protein [Vicinamibacterales bacterium]|nr:exosortase/archaeosortase family protein [Vicinamibacterales bacterium]